MHAISYQLKRGHLSAVALGRRILRGTKPPEDPDYDGVPDMTPARFDILFLVYGRRLGPMLPPPRHTSMAELVRKLGLARATISKGVKRLVQLGLVTCELDLGRRREKIVEITDEGVARLKRAMQLVFTTRQLARHYRHFIGKDCQHSGIKNLPRYINEQLDDVWYGLKCLAQHLFDRSEALYYIRAYSELEYGADNL